MASHDIATMVSEEEGDGPSGHFAVSEDLVYYKLAMSNGEGSVKLRRAETPTRRTNEDSGEDSDASLAPILTVSLGTSMRSKKKRGRHLTTREYTGLAKAKRAARKDLEKDEEKALEREILYGDCTPPSAGKLPNPLLSQEEYNEQARRMSIPELVAGALKAADQIEMVGAKSTQLNDAVKRQMRVSARILRATIIKLAIRAKRVEEEAEVNSIKSKIRELEEENARLRERIAALDKKTRKELAPKEPGIESTGGIWEERRGKSKAARKEFTDEELNVLMTKLSGYVQDQLNEFWERLEAHFFPKKKEPAIASSSFNKEAAPAKTGKIMPSLDKAEREVDSFSNEWRKSKWSRSPKNLRHL